ncbi:MAG TPA: exo-beta-N-acetylmuramidase NamZ domain-containing protein [Bryobacteraceae bacterium]|nr:exo-beta-N-acetylmuramidase NamZ domain-containing protein [Bryobacteraceae bacterium]
MEISRRFLLAGLSFAPALAEAAPQRSPSATGTRAFSASAKLDAIIKEAIQDDLIPGAVLIVGRGGRIVHRRAYGFRAVEPRREPMTVDTVFDIASLTKVVATTSAIAKLFEAGKLRLNDRVTQYLPEFQGGDSPITVRNLLTHFSGMRPDVDLKPVWSGYDTGVKLALADRPIAPPGSRMIYSDINFILLGEIVRRVSGKPLPDFVRENVFAPLGMRLTMFQPPDALRRRIAPTERVDGVMLRGIVHDPTTRYMNGIAGHAGVFSTADDLARFAQMMLDQGRRAGVRVFSPATIEKFTTPQTPPDQPVLRGLGWDMDSPFSGNRGELFPIGSYGHTGFTGTSLWIDPVSKSYVILLANSVHPHVRPAITSLRGRVSTVTAAAAGIVHPGISLTGYNEAYIGNGVPRVVARNVQVLTGLDTLVTDRFSKLAGRRVGLITNHTGLDRDGRRNLDLMVEARVNVVAVFSPEHGLTGSEDHENIGHGKDAATGVPIWSLYAGKDRRPTDQMLRGVDTLMFDIQDIGARFYTYVTTMAYAMEEAARRRIPFWVLDRPNPITGTHIEGPPLDDDLRSFVGYMDMPLRHGLTAGELARMFNAKNRIGADLTVIEVQGWNRGDWFDSTGLVWTDPSPNMRSLTAALLYPGVAMIEYATNFSVGRGTDAPFEQVGADWIRGRDLAGELNTRFIPGVRVYPTRFTPAKDAKLGGLVAEGVRFVITSREAFDSARLGVEVAAALQRLYPGKINLEENLRLIGNRRTVDLIKNGEDPRLIQQGWEEPLQAFAALREDYRLYK